MEELPPQLQALLAEARDADDPQPGERARIHASFEQKLAKHGITGLPSPHGQQTGSPDAASATGSGGLSTALQLGLTSLLVGGLGVALVSVGTKPEHPQRDAAPTNTSSKAVTSAVVKPTSPHGGQASGSQQVTDVGVHVPVEQAAGGRTGPASGPRDSKQGVSPRPSIPDPDAVSEGRDVSKLAFQRAPRAVSQQDRIGGQQRAGSRQTSPSLASASGRVGAPDRPTPASRQTAGTPKARSQHSPLAEEIRILSAARRALGRGDGHGALRYLAQHASRFSRGALEEERRGLEVLALCTAGRTVQASRARRNFLRSTPDGVLAQRVRKACVPSPRRDRDP